MKVASNLVEQQFRPVVVSLTLESQEEIDALFQFSYFDSSVPKALRAGGMEEKKLSIVEELLKVLRKELNHVLGC